MKMIILFIVLVSYFFIVTATLAAMAADPLIQSLSTGQNQTYIIDANVTNVNVSALPSKPGSAGGFLSMAARMFTFSIPTSLLPNFMGNILSFFNWILIILFGIVVYRLSVPTSGG